VKSVSPDLHCREKKPSGGNADTRPVPITFQVAGSWSGWSIISRRLRAKP
jgi:hypothetical protein